MGTGHGVPPEKGEAQMTQVTYGAVTVETASLPPVSAEAMIRRGLSHYFGNEQAAKVTALKDKWIGDKDANPEATPATDEQVSKWLAEARQAAFEKLMAGTVGAGRLTGPRIDPIESATLAIAKVEVTNILRAAGVKPPKGEETVSLAGEAFTMAQLIERRLAKEGDRIAKEAAKRVADQKKKAEKAKADVASAGENKTADALGL